jgi:amino acid transporter
MIISFVITGIVAFLAALSFSELAAMMSHSGAAYTYTYASQLIILSLFCPFNYRFFSFGRYLLNGTHPEDELFSIIICRIFSLVYWMELCITLSIGSVDSRSQLEQICCTFYRSSL